jgi:transcriptional regulator NrdR family protein
VSEQRATDVQNKGLVCGQCGCRHFWTTDKRDGDGYIRRRRECRNCGKRVTTTERIVGAK